MEQPHPPRHRAAVALVVLAQWFGTSLWFSPSGAADGLMARLDIGVAGFGWLIAATQLGFIAGTMVGAATGVADRFAASRIFAISCVVGATANAALVAPGLTFAPVWALRFAVGVCLAGIYPLGMKMIVQWVGGKPAAALCWLVGMLVLGTAMPQGLRAAGASWPWEAVLLASSLLAVLGAVLVFLLGEGPSALPPGGASIESSEVVAGHDHDGALQRIFAIPGVRAAAFGYFGHMWEVYAFWSVLPLLCAPLCSSLVRNGDAARAPSVALLSFAVIAVGAVGCIAGGQISRRVGSAAVAAVALAGSGLMCLLYPLLPDDAPAWRVGALFVWGFCVVADSPQLSALSARHAPMRLLGSVLAAQNGIGFLITVVSILALSRALPLWGVSAVWILVPGPVLGLLALRPLLQRGTEGLSPV